MIYSHRHFDEQLPDMHRTCVLQPNSGTENNSQAQTTTINLSNKLVSLF